jgi:hypothetical protein
MGGGERHNPYMPNIASILKAEVSRLARKESRGATDALKRAIGAQRAEISALKKRVQQLERGVARGNKSLRSTLKVAPAAEDQAGEGAGLRFRAAGMAANRKRLGLSAADFGKLVGATGPTCFYPQL